MRTMMMLGLVAAVAADGTYKINQWVSPFGDEDQCAKIPFTDGCDCDTEIRGGAIHIEGGYEKGKDFLQCTGCNAKDIVTEFDGEKGILYLTGKATIATYGAALANVEFKTTSSSAKMRELIMNYGHGLFSRKNHHFYDYVKGKHSWIDAQAKCADESNDILGLVGYLMTISSQGEQDIAKSKLTGRGWMGASDAGTEGTWRWMTGPEGCPGANGYDTSKTGASRSACKMEPITHTFDGCGGSECNGGTLIGHQNGGFTPAANSYTNWAPGEPNEYRHDCPGLCTTAGEDYGHFYADGNWNDYPIVHTMDGFMCEWGGVGNLCMPYNYMSKSILLYDTCPPSAEVEAYLVPKSGIVSKIDGVAITEGMMGWTVDEATVRLTQIPQVYKQAGAKVFLPDQNEPVPEGTSFRLKCPFNCEGAPCDFYVTTYHCPPCSRETNGKLTGLLPADGWVAGSCAPRFSFVAENYHMVAFHKQLASGETYDLPTIEGELVHVAIWGSNNAVACEEQNREDTCVASNTCAWIDDKCISDWCPRIRHTPTGSKPNQCIGNCAPTKFN
eukprot:TRINITY_DN1955_c0_g1_i1.p1 TRINITY_DN1955_c0_g1~~TRINITY_DN1955_c0_g1_i1.p1  ORF type:complete len:557 (+),score=190.52 TRINITY_DN1955_c0_g1_i1:73-1743(+)